MKPTTNNILVEITEVDADGIMSTTKSTITTAKAVGDDCTMVKPGDTIAVAIDDLIAIGNDIFVSEFNVRGIK